MPDTEQCILGTENKMRILNLEKAVERIENNIEKLTNHYSGRPSWPVTIVLISLITTLTNLAVWMITH